MAKTVSQYAHTKGSLKMPTLLIILLTLSAALLLYAVYIALHIKKHGERYPNRPSFLYISTHSYTSPILPDSSTAPCNSHHDCSPNSSHHDCP